MLCYKLCSTQICSKYSTVLVCYCSCAARLAEIYGVCMSEFICLFHMQMQSKCGVGGEKKGAGRWEEDQAGKSLLMVCVGGRGRGLVSIS